MKNLLVPVSIKPNSLLDDRITVGIIAISKSKTMFEFSPEKVKKIYSFLDENSRKYVLSALKTL